MKKIGILCYATSTGLGHQTRDYAKYIQPYKVLAVDLSKHNGMPLHREWYKDFNTIWTQDIPTVNEINAFLDGLDAVFLAETPLNYYLYEEANRRGIKTFQAYNFEFLDYFRKPYLAKPTVLAAPTTWNIDVVRALNIAEVQHWPVPVEMNAPPKDISSCKTVIHIIGRPAAHDRNGTLSFLSAIEKIGNKLNYIIYFQTPKEARAVEYFQPVLNRIQEVRQKVNLRVVADSPDSEDLYKEGDLLVLPRRYGGLCLPMQEALAKGIPVVMTGISPNTDILPHSWLASATQIDYFRGHTDIPIYNADVDNLADKILQFEDSEFVKLANKTAISIAERIAWHNLKEQYITWLSQ